MNPFLSSNANLEVYVDSVFLRLLPLKDSVWLYKGERVVLAELDVHSGDSIDSLWVKLAHSEEIQGWIRQQEIVESFVSTDTISQIIHYLTTSDFQWVALLISFAVLLSFVWMARKKMVKFIGYNDIESSYPLFLCLLTAVCGTLYQSIRNLSPELWVHYTFNPTLSPGAASSWPVTAFLICVWLVLIAGVAAIGELFRYLTSGLALLYLLGLLAACVCCYLFFAWSTAYYYLGYPLLVAFSCLFLMQLSRAMCWKYCCGNCGKRMKAKGICSHCEAINR